MTWLSMQKNPMDFFFSYWICEFNTFIGQKTDIQKNLIIFPYINNKNHILNILKYYL